MKDKKMKQIQNMAFILAAIGIVTAVFTISNVYVKRKPMSKAKPASAQVEVTEKTLKESKTEIVAEEKLPEKEKPNPVATEEKSEDAEVTNSNPGNSSPSTESGNSGSSPNNNQPSNSTLPPETTTAKAENNYLTRAEMEALANEMVAYARSYATSRGVTIDSSITPDMGESIVNIIDYDPAYNGDLKADQRNTIDFFINNDQIKRINIVWYWDNKSGMIVIDYYYNW